VLYALLSPRSAQGMFGSLGSVEEAGAGCMLPGNLSGPSYAGPLEYGAGSGPKGSLDGPNPAKKLLTSLSIASCLAQHLTWVPHLGHSI